MAEDRHLVLARTLLLIGITVLVGGALEEMDEALYLLLISQLAPPPACPEHEVYQVCSGNCSDCVRRGICRANCSFKGCDCIHNFARMEPRGPCQPVHLCPAPECGENEVFRECGPVCERCGGMRCRMLQCEHRCYCEEGHLRDEGGRCVPEEQCPHKARCFRDEEMGPSGRVDEYCLRDEATSNATETRNRCYCREGFSRNAMGHCVRDELCEKVLCPGVEVYQSCPRKCNVTCRGGGDCEEDGQCFPGCFCPEGYLVDDFRRCVPDHHCPTGSSTPTPVPSTDSSAPLISTTEVSSSISSSATTDDEEILELPKEVAGGTLPTTATADETTTTTTSTQGGIETSRSSATTTTAEQGEITTTVAPLITEQETTMADNGATTPEMTTTPKERRRDDVVTTTAATTTSTTTTTRPSEEEENDF